MDEVKELKKVWLEEVRKEAQDANPLRGFCERVYFSSTSKGRRNGKIRRRKAVGEVELLRFLPSGRCVVVNDLETKDLDSLAEEVFHGKGIDPGINPAQLFLDLFREL